MLEFVNSLNNLDKNTEKVCFIGSYAHVKAGVHKKAFPHPGWDFLDKDVSENENPKKPLCLTTRTGFDEPRQLCLCVLPDKVSRGNSPTRKEWIYQQANLTGKGSLVILGLDKEEHYPAAAGALARKDRNLDFKSKDDKDSKDKGPIRVVAVNKRGQVIRAGNELAKLATSVAWCAEMVDTPPSDLNPKEFSSRIKKLLKPESHVTIKEVVGEALVKQGLMGIYSVGKTAIEAPRMMVLDYNPPRAKGTVGLVGKGLTYDTGGLSLKTGGFMVGMKMDMGGAAAVVGAFKFLSATGLKKRVIAVVGLAENAIGPASYKPDDIIRMHSGKTVEVNNTDAEGRLVIGDCLSYISREYSLDMVMEAATLTGAQLVATGVMHAAVVSNNDKLEALAYKAGKTTGDLVWSLPFAPEFFLQEFDSPLADMTNSVKNRMNAQSSCAGHFVHAHVGDEQLPWLHIDLAGTAADTKGLGTGYGVALMSELASIWG